MNFVKGRFSWMIRPGLIIFDLALLALAVIQCFTNTLNTTYFVFFELTAWIVIAFSLQYYEVYRFTSVIKIFTLISKQFLLFSLATFAYFGFYRSQANPIGSTLMFLSFVLTGITLIKYGVYFSLRKYREKFDGNFRNVIIIGKSDAALQLKNFFEKKKYLGYKLIDVLENTNNQSALESLYKLNGIPLDEIYCALDDLNDEEINEFIQYADVKNCNLKFIPSTQKLFTKRLKTDYYEYQPVLSLPKPVIDVAINSLSKRIFDVLFSFMICVCFLSWLTPILALLIKIDSRGPVFFQHKRHGLNYKEFWCYKFRTLRTDFKEDELAQVKKNDRRVTKVGRWLRKSSLDELPQFINVLLGDMSVVGPRPHMIQYTKTYSKKLDKLNFVFRHSVKPGITGLAQIKGYRGEIHSDDDLVNRFKYDVFYIENWSLLMDLKIILETVVKIIKGDEKAY